MNTDYRTAIGPNDKSLLQWISMDIASMKYLSSAPVACVPHPQTLVSRLQHLGL